MSNIHICLLGIISDVIDRCIDKSRKRRLLKYHKVVRERHENNYKLSFIHDVLKDTQMSFREFEMKAFKGITISDRYHDVGPFGTYTLLDLLKLLRHKDIRLEGCLANIPANVHRTKSLTVCYLLAAKDVLEMGSITEVLWNMKQLRADEE